MFDRLTEQSRQAFARANQFARILDGDCITDADVLLGIVHNYNCRAVCALQCLGVDELSALRSKLKELPRSTISLLVTGRLPQTRQAKAAIEVALRVADEMEHAKIETGHLLLGILSDPNTDAARCLAEVGVTFAKAQQVIGELIRTAPAEQ